MRLAFLLAIVETALVVASVLQWRWALVIAATVFAFHAFAGRRARYETIRQLSWAAAVSQTLPVLVPVIAAAALALAILVIVAAAFVVLVLFFFSRR